MTKYFKEGVYPNVVDQHFVQAHWSQRALDNVGDGGCGHDCKTGVGKISWMLPKQLYSRRLKLIRLAYKTMSCQFGPLVGWVRASTQIWQLTVFLFPASEAIQCYNEKWMVLERGVNMLTWHRQFRPTADVFCLHLKFHKCNYWWSLTLR